MIYLFNYTEYYLEHWLYKLFRHCRGICLIITLHRDACNKICKTLSVVRFIANRICRFYLHRDACNKICKTLSVVRHTFHDNIMFINRILYRYIMFGRGICEKYQSRDEKFPEPNGEGNLV
jgi:hypothetical protein